MRAGFNCTKCAICLGPANVSQTDTYLSAKIAGFRESMTRFDGSGQWDHKLR
jgi:hypothetical protein